MKPLNALKLRILISVILAVLACINFFFNAPRFAVALYWIFVYTYWLFGCLTDTNKVILMQREQDEQEEKKNGND